MPTPCDMTIKARKYTLVESGTTAVPMPARQIPAAKITFAFGTLSYTGPINDAAAMDREWRVRFSTEHTHFA